MSNYWPEYVNEFGDEWTFEVDPELGVCLLTGTDIPDDLRVPVIDGVAVGLVLSTDEAEWVQASWDDGTAGNPLFSLYRGLDTEFVAGPGHCLLTDNYCPICLRVKQEFDVHHCIWRADGGTDDAFNLLRICRSCHALITWGDAEERVPRDMAAFSHQLMHFGMRFIAKQSPPDGNEPDRPFLDGRPKTKAAVGTYLASTEAERHEVDVAVRQFARVQYQYYREVARGIGPFVEYRDRELANLAAFNASRGRDS